MELLLRKQIAFCNGKFNSNCRFTATELMKATNKQSCWDVTKIQLPYLFKLHQGLLEDRSILVMKFADYEDRYPFNSIMFASQMCRKNT